MEWRSSSFCVREFCFSSFSWCLCEQSGGVCLFYYKYLLTVVLIIIIISIIVIIILTYSCLLEGEQSY